MGAKKRLRLSRAWVPVSPSGVVCWHCASQSRITSCALVAHGRQNWPSKYRHGWRIVRCRVERK